MTSTSPPIPVLAPRLEAANMLRLTGTDLLRIRRASGTIILTGAA